MSHRCDPAIFMIFAQPSSFFAYFLVVKIFCQAISDEWIAKIISECTRYGGNDWQNQIKNKQQNCQNKRRFEGSPGEGLKRLSTFLCQRTLDRYHHQRDHQNKQI